MTDRTDVPLFGDRVEGCAYVLRPSAYALVRNAGGEVAVVRTPRGTFLPGGGIEAGESAEQTIEREAIEECGLVVLPGRTIGTAIQIVHSADEDTCFEKRSTFLEAVSRGRVPAKERDHELAWLKPAEAVDALSHESHRWGVRRLTTIAIRPAVADDEAWIRGLIPRLHEFGPPAYRAIDAMNESEAVATVAAIEGGNDRAVLIAEDESGARLGFVHLETAADFFTRERHGHVSAIVVAAEAERRGVGGAMLDAAEEWCRRRGYRLLTLNVFEHNSAARRLYERSGFRIDTIKYAKPLS